MKTIVDYLTMMSVVSKNYFCAFYSCDKKYNSNKNKIW